MASDSSALGFFGGLTGGLAEGFRSMLPLLMQKKKQEADARLQDLINRFKQEQADEDKRQFRIEMAMEKAKIYGSMATNEQDPAFAKQFWGLTLDAIEESGEDVSKFRALLDSLGKKKKDDVPDVPFDPSTPPKTVPEAVGRGAKRLSSEKALSLISPFAGMKEGLGEIDKIIGKAAGDLLQPSGEFTLIPDPKTGRLMNSKGEFIKKGGHFIDVRGRPVDEKGNLIAIDGFFPLGDPESALVPGVTEAVQSPLSSLFSLSPISMGLRLLQNPGVMQRLGLRGQVQDENVLPMIVPEK